MFTEVKGHYRTDRRTGTKYWVNSHERLLKGSYPNLINVTKPYWQNWPNGYINSNATCPYCGASIYYFENHLGSKVWFDDLGPSWPKHECFYSENMSHEKVLENYRLCIPLLVKKRISRNGLIYLQLINPGANELFYVILSNFPSQVKSAFLYNFFLERPVLQYFDSDVLQVTNERIIDQISGDSISRLEFTGIAKSSCANFSTLREIKNFVKSTKSLHKHHKLSIALWLYENTALDYRKIAYYSGLILEDIEDIADEKLKPTHDSISPIKMGLISETAFKYMNLYSNFLSNVDCLRPR